MTADSQAASLGALDRVDLGFAPARIHDDEPDQPGSDDEPDDEQPDIELGIHSRRSIGSRAVTLPRMLDFMPNPVAIQLGPLPVYWYGIGYALGLAAAYLVMIRLGRSGPARTPTSSATG